MIASSRIPFSPVRVEPRDGVAQFEAAVVGDLIAARGKSTHPAVLRGRLAVTRLPLPGEVGPVMPGLGEKLFSLADVANRLGQASSGGVQSRRRKAGVRRALEHREIRWGNGLRSNVGRQEDDGCVEFQQPQTEKARLNRRLN